MKKLLFIPLLLLFILNSYYSKSQLPAGNSDGKPRSLNRLTIKISGEESSLSFPNYRHFSHQDGLPRGFILSLIQTEDGFAWLIIEKHGLVRFDGYHFTSFVPTPGDTTSLPSSDLTFMTKSKNQGLWIISLNGVIWLITEVMG